MYVNRLGDHAGPRTKPALLNLDRRCMHLEEEEEEEING